MKATEHVVQTYRRQLEEHRQEIAELERLAEALRRQQTKIEGEQKAAEAAGSAPRHVAAMAERRARIEQSLAEVDVNIRQARDGLSEAYYGVRRSEIAASARAEQHRRRRAS
jgi:DNA repair ATPase RecN